VPGTPEAGPTRTGGPGSTSGIQPNAAKADLTGRTGAPGPKAPAAGPQPALGGRHGRLGAPGESAADRRASGGASVDHELEAWESDELWVPESEAVGTIEAPTEHRPQQQGKALGQS
jgi:hypothetical protein